MPHPAYPQPFAPQDWVMLAIILSPIAALFVWGFFRSRRARDDIRNELRSRGFDVIQMKQRTVRRGPFWKTSRGQIVYRLLVRDNAGRQRTGWVRWGRNLWIPESDLFEFQWDQ